MLLRGITVFCGCLPGSEVGIEGSGGIWLKFGRTGDSDFVEANKRSACIPDSWGTEWTVLYI